ncbi:nuclear transport factor 2 family protein [Thalassotalea mangrovi]|nr:nuclear transport factor 2 family protein [Thalassotalea mangrovi]
MKNIYKVMLVMWLASPPLSCSYANPTAQQAIDFSQQVDPELAKVIFAEDQAFFTAFNQGNKDVVNHYFTPELEFYHDMGGLSNYQQNVENTNNLLSRADRPTRRLITEDFEVHPVKGFGAIQTGSHEFCHMENDHLDCGTFKFLHIWKQTKAGWKLHRIVSYGH